jgi:hypothetical protein
MMKKALDCGAAVERHDEQARSGQPSGLQNAPAAGIAEDDIMTPVSCLAKWREVRLDGDVGDLRGLQNDGDQPTHAPASAKEDMIGETLTLVSDGGLLGRSKV